MALLLLRLFLILIMIGIATYVTLIWRNEPLIWKYNPMIRKTWYARNFGDDDDNHTLLHWHSNSHRDSFSPLPKKQSISVNTIKPRHRAYP